MISSVRFRVNETVSARSTIPRLISRNLKRYNSSTVQSKKSAKKISNKVIGIDLGTTNSAVAVIEGETPKILENKDGDKTTPSIVAFSNQGDGEVLIGNNAKRQSIVNHQNTFYATKRLIGRKFDDDEVQKDIEMVPYNIVKHDNGDSWLETSQGVRYSPSQIGGFVLREMKKIAEENLDEEIRNAVITVPAYFNDSQRQATKIAGELVGLNVLRIVNEPTAASLAYGLGNKNDGIVAVYDLGGGTFDISILDIEDGVFEVRSTNGDTHLGGEDFDNLLVNYIIDKFKKDTGNDLKNDRLAIQRIRQAAEKAKIELSHVKETKIELPFITKTENISFKLTEDELDAMSLHLINKTIEPVKKAIKDADLTKKDIDDVILVGGMTRMPKIRKTVEKFFGIKPNININPDEAVALGAAIQGAVLSGEVKDVLLLDVTPLTLGIETYGGLFSPLIPRNTTVPCKIKQMYSTAVDGQNSIDINVYQGERPIVEDNKLIGKVKLSGIPPQPKGVPKIEVSFDIDADGIIKVSAKDKDSGKNAYITVFGSTGLTNEEIEKLVNDSKDNQDSDIQRKNLLSHVSNLELIVFDAEDAIKKLNKFIDYNDKDGDDLKMINEFNRKIEIVKNIISDARKGDLNNGELIKAAQEELKEETLNIIQQASNKSKK